MQAGQEAGASSILARRNSQQAATGSHPIDLKQSAGHDKQQALVTAAGPEGTALALVKESRRSACSEASKPALEPNSYLQLKQLKRTTVCHGSSTRCRNTKLAVRRLKSVHAVRLRQYVAAGYAAAASNEA